MDRRLVPQQAAEKRWSRCSPGLQSGEAGFQTHFNIGQQNSGLPRRSEH
jgi:hypothetical protein